MTSLPLRTCLFAVVERRFARPIEGATDIPERRARRRDQLGSVVGRFVFGTTDPSVTTSELVVDVEGHACRLLVHRPAELGPDERVPVVLNLHGGGWVQGSPEQSRWLASRVAARTDCVVVSPDYRLAPEHLFPAAVDDVRAVLQWLVTADLGIDPERLAVMGDSAGGNLAAVAALQARDAGGPTICAQVLVYPSVEIYERFASEDEHADAPVLTSANMNAYARMYLGDAYGTHDWRASPLRAASLAGLPPALVVVAVVDPLADDGRHYAQALRTAGVLVEVSEHPGALHGFMSLPGVSPPAHEALDDIVTFLREQW